MPATSSMNSKNRGKWDMPRVIKKTFGRKGN